MTDDEDFLATIDLTPHQWRGLRDLASAGGDMEPLAKRANLGKVVADQLVELGLAERGRSTERYAAIGLDVGYRLSDLGWKVIERGRYAKRDRPSGPKLTMAEPRVKTADLRIAKPPRR